MLFRKKVYMVNVICDNCDERSEIKIPKGIDIKDHLLQSKGLCPNCGVPVSLEYQKEMEMGK